MLFYAYFSVSKKRNIKRSRNEINWRSYFWKETHPMDLEPTSEDTAGAHEGGGRAHPPRALPLPRGAPEAPPTYFLHPYIFTYPKTSRTDNRSGVPPPEASVATESQSRPFPAPCRRGQSFSCGHLHHPGALHDEEGIVLPRG